MSNKIKTALSFLGAAVWFAVLYNHSVQLATKEKATAGDLLRQGLYALMTLYGLSDFFRAIKK